VKDVILDRFERIVRRVAPPILSKRDESYDVIQMAQLKAAYESAEYYEQHMLEVRPFKTDLELLSYAISISPQRGLFLEFGVATGRTISHIASTHLGPIYGFDSFEGLPERWRPRYGKGHFAGPIPALPSNVHLIKGQFTDVLPSFLRSHSEMAAFLHVDCDLYSSTKCIFDVLEDRIGPGCVIVFDEYFNYPGWQGHEFKAFQEFVGRRALEYRYEGLVPSHQQVCVSIRTDASAEARTDVQAHNGKKPETS
jgi:hypothetical protein